MGSGGWVGANVVDTRTHGPHAHKAPAPLAARGSQSARAAGGGRNGRACVEGDVCE